MGFRNTIFPLLFFATKLAGQTFQPVEGSVLQQEIAFEQANLCFIHFQNSGVAPLQLKWRKLEISAPENWEIDLCDYGSCYIGVPPNGLMNPLTNDTAIAYLKLIVRPGTTPGAAWIWFKVIDNQDDANFQDVYFDLRTAGVSQNSEISPPEILAFPNPANELLFLKNGSSESQEVGLFDVFGNPVLQKNLPGGTLEKIGTETWQNGPYFLKTGHKTFIVNVLHE